MSRWDDQFETHAFRSAWISLNTLISDEVIETNNNEEAIKEIARLRKVAAYIGSILDHVDPELMPAASLNAMSTSASVFSFGDGRASLASPHEYYF